MEKKEEKNLDFEGRTMALLDFINESPTVYHAVAALENRLKNAGFLALREGDSWNLKRGGSYYVTRSESAIIAFTIPESAPLSEGCRILASHGDSPSFKIKENPEMCVEDHYVKLNVEKYGGMLMAPWFDRPLSVAGRVLFAGKDGKIESKLVNVDRDLLLIPNLAIHMNRQVNDGYAYNAQKDMLPLYGLAGAKGTFMDVVAEAAGLSADAVLGHDLFLYNRTAPVIWGAQNEFVSAPRLDDLQCAFASMAGFLRADRSKQLSLCCVFDNEEVGSETNQGADGTFLYDVLARIAEAFGASIEESRRMLANGFMISADNAHAIHPNHTDMADPVNRPYINEGIVIKYNAAQKYCTDGVSAARFKALCKKAGVPYQTFTNRSDIAGGSTLGNLSNTHVAISTVDVGLPQLAMHSPYETAGVKDTAYFVAAAEQFFTAS